VVATRRERAATRPSGGRWPVGRSGVDTWCGTPPLQVLMRAGTWVSIRRAIRHAARVDLVATGLTWNGCGPRVMGRRCPLLQWEVEPCHTGQVAAGGRVFSHDVRGIVDRMLRDSLPTAAGTAKGPLTGRRGRRCQHHDRVLEALLDTNAPWGGRQEVIGARLRADKESTCRAAASSAVGRPAR